MSQIPAVLYYQRKDVNEMLDFKALPHLLDTSILSQDTSIAKKRVLSTLVHTSIQLDEIPKRGTLLSIDAEFVLLQQVRHQL